VSCARERILAEIQDVSIPSTYTAVVLLVFQDLWSLQRERATEQKGYHISHPPKLLTTQLLGSAYGIFNWKSYKDF